MTQPHWIDDGDAIDGSAWNTCILGGNFLPGIVTVTCEKGKDVEVKKEKGKDGATLEDQGIDPAPVTIEIQLPKRADWELWQEVLPKIDPRRPGGPREPLEIVHPMPNHLGITDIYVKKIKPSPPTAKGGMRVTLECIEWFPQPKKPKKKATKSSKAQPAVPEAYGKAKHITQLTPEQRAFAPTGIDAIANVLGSG